MRFIQGPEFQKQAKNRNYLILDLKVLQKCSNVLNAIQYTIQLSYE